MRISDWSSDVCSSDLSAAAHRTETAERRPSTQRTGTVAMGLAHRCRRAQPKRGATCAANLRQRATILRARCSALNVRSEEHTSELQSLMRISYAVFCLKKKKKKMTLIHKYATNTTTTTTQN